MEFLNMIVGLLALLPMALVALGVCFAVLWGINLIFGDNYS